MKQGVNGELSIENSDILRLFNIHPKWMYILSKFYMQLHLSCLILRLVCKKSRGGLQHKNVQV